jgi:ketosteroid isomerase-like protein
MLVSFLSRIIPGERTMFNKINIPFLAVITALICVTDFAYSDPTADLILRLEHDLADAAPKKDVAKYEKYLADDFTGQWADGSSSTKAETIEDLRSDHDQYEAVELKDLKVRIYGDTAVVTGMFYEKSTLGEHDATGLYRFTDVWIKKSNQWQVVAFQSVKLPKYASK